MLLTTYISYLVIMRITIRRKFIGGAQIQLNFNNYKFALLWGETQLCLLFASLPYVCVKKSKREGNL